MNRLHENYYSNTARKMSKYGFFSGTYFPVFGLNTGKYGPGKTLYLDAFYAVKNYQESIYSGSDV